MPRDDSNHAVSRRSLARGARASSLHAQICFLVFWGTPQPHSHGQRRIPCVWGPDPPTDTVRAEGLDMAGQVVGYAREQRRAALEP